MEAQHGVRFRRATCGDADAIADFHVACWHAAYAGIVPSAYLDDLTCQDRAAAWRQRLTRLGDVTTVVFVDGDLAGLATVGPSDERPPLPATELRSFYVAADWYGTGLAQRLMRTVLGRRSASLWVFRDNGRARAFYAKTGWRSTGECRVDPRLGVPELRLVRRPR